MSRDELRWIKVSSNQAVLMSSCLQGMVQELLAGKFGPKVKTVSIFIFNTLIFLMKKTNKIMHFAVENHSH